MTEKLDIIIFGATGYSAQRILSQLLKISSKENRTITWGIAGRTFSKLQKVLQELAFKTGKIFDKIPIILASTEDFPSLATMASRSRLIINCTGPFKTHGEPVVRACIQENCHYMDISAEPQFVERIQIAYDKEAEEKRVYVVPACGLESIVTDVGVDYVRKKFSGTLNSVEIYHEVVPVDKKLKLFSSYVNYGTLSSFLYTVGESKKVDGIQLEPKLSTRILFPRLVPLSKSYAGPYPASDDAIIRRSQHYFYKKNNLRPIQVNTYLANTSFLSYCVFRFGMLFLKLFSKFQFFVLLFLRYPNLFTFGFIGDHPEERNTNNLEIITTFYGQGWKGRIVDEKFRFCEDSSIVVKVLGRDPYESTGICIVTSALVLLDSESQKLPKRGGVFTPAPFFTGTDLVEMLERNGLKFEVCGHYDL